MTPVVLCLRKEPNMSRQAAADYYGITVKDASIKQWKELNRHGINPKKVMEDDHYVMAYDYMFWRVARMVDAMMDVFPDMERRLFAFVNYYEMPETWQEMVVRFIFKQDDNLVWPLIRADDGLTQIKHRAEAWMEEIATRRDGWMFN